MAILFGVADLNLFRHLEGSIYHDKDLVRSITLSVEHLAPLQRPRIVKELSHRLLRVP